MHYNGSQLSVWRTYFHEFEEKVPGQMHRACLGDKSLFVNGTICRFRRPFIQDAMHSIYNWQNICRHKNQSLPTFTHHNIHKCTMNVSSNHIPRVYVLRFTTRVKILSKTFCMTIKETVKAVSLRDY